MPRLYSCPNGHRWEDSFGDFDSVSAEQTVACPVCGAQVRIETPKQPSTFKSAVSDGSAPSKTITLPGGAAPATAPPAKPSVIAGHEIVGELGRGGMGVVYKARHLRLQRTVALKMLLAGAHANPVSLARFRAEAEAVARLQHPNIVQIYETGEEDGRPYFSMEFIEGKNLVAHIGNNPQPAREAAQLTATLARAMQAAHQRGIIHRDLKPANILLTGNAERGTGKEEPPAFPVPRSPFLVPKITDFGLAKRLDDLSNQTRTGDVMGTPSYMAPEQATGRVKEIGPATDVYALGAILYEMLTGRPPFKAETAMDTMLQVLQLDPVPPSRLLAKTPRDLETICLKCLAKEPRKRYASAQALAEDLERFLDGRSITARPAGLAERGVKWVRRRPAIAALAASIVLALTAIGAVLGWSYVEQKQLNDELGKKNTLLKDAVVKETDLAAKAEAARKKAVDASTLAKNNEKLAQKNFEKARQAVQAMLTEVAEKELANIPLMGEMRQKLLTRALDFHREFLTRKSNEPGVRQQAALANLQVGEIEHLLGRYDEAKKAFQEGIGLLAGLAKEFPQRPDYRQKLALGQFQFGRMLRELGQMPEAEKAYRQALQLQEALKTAHPAEALYRQDLAHTHNDLARLLHLTEQSAAARQAYQSALDIQQALVHDFPDRPDYVEDLAGTWIDLGVFLSETGKPEEAQQAYDRALQLLRPLAEKPRAAPVFRWKLGTTYNNLGNVQRDLLQRNQAEKSFEQALKYRSKLRSEFPSNLKYRRELAETYNNLASLLETDPKRVNDADADYVEAVRWLRELVADVPSVPEFQNSLASVLDNQAGLLLKQKKVTQAREVLQEAAKHHEAAGRDRAAYRPFLCNHYARLADALLTPAEMGEAPRHAEAAKAAAQLARLCPEDCNASLKAAVLFARCRKLALADSRLAGEQRQNTVEAYSDQAMTMLRKAVALGYRDVAQLKKAAAFVPLHGRDDFKNLLEEMQKKRTD